MRRAFYEVLTPSPGTPGEGWGEGNSFNAEKSTLTLPSPGVPGEEEELM